MLIFFFLEKARESMELRLQEFKKIIDQIKKFFNETDIERLVASYLKLEEDNYNIFSFINEYYKEEIALTV